MRGEPMSAHTSFRVGGPADFLLQIGTQTQLTQVLGILEEAGEPYYLLGRGTNLLVGDGGYRGCMITLTGPEFAGVCFPAGGENLPVDSEGREMGNMTDAGMFIASPGTDANRDNPDTSPYNAERNEEGVCLSAGAGEPLSALASAARDLGLTGLEFAAGIPGSVGGAIVMNAGAYGGSMEQVVVSARLLMPGGIVREVPAGELHFGYRHSLLKEISAIVLRVELVLSPGDPDQITETMKELARRRSQKQPLEYPSAGSTFKRPEGMFAGKLIMEAGLRGFSIGGAAVSEKHCGFVINRDGASAADVRAVIDAVRKRVYETSGVTLEEEVIQIGEF